MDGEKLILKYEQLIAQFRITHWVESEVFSLLWWISLLVLLIPWFVWYRLVVKDRIIENLVYGFLMSITHLTIDEFATEFSMLISTTNLVPIFPRFIIFNYTVIPVIFMLIYQYFPAWKSFVAACILAGGIYSFVLMPLLVRINYLVLLEWNHFYTLLSIAPTAILMKLLMKLINSAETGKS